MKHFKGTVRYIIFALACALIVGATDHALAQDASRPASSSTPRQRSERDPFEKYRPPVKRARSVATQIAPPSIQERIQRYKAQKMAAMNAQLPAPKPTTALLLGEVQITG